MKSLHAVSLRKGIISVIAVFAMTVPGIGSAGLFDSIKSRVQVVKADANTDVVNGQETRSRPKAHSGFSVVLATSKKVEENQLFLTYTINLR